MTTQLDAIRFLADSENRFTAISELAVGSRSRSELRRATGASSATISRLLGDFESRGWVTREGNRYAVTPLGRYVTSAFADLYDRMTTANDLGELLPWFPLQELDVDFDVELLTGARITAASPQNPLAAMVRVLEIERESAWTNTLAAEFPEPCIDARHEAVVVGTQTFEVVVTPTVVERAMTAAYADKFEEIVVADRSDVYVYDGDVGPLGGIHDGTAYLIVVDDRDVSVGVIESDDRGVVDWLAGKFDAYREESTRLTASELLAVHEAIRAET